MSAARTDARTPRATRVRTALLALLAACARAHADPATVAIAHFAFAPAEITIAPGTSVVWINRDETPHAVRAADGAFASAALDTGDRYQRQFAKAGDYPYLCTLHPFMTGVVHVRAGAAAERPAAARRSNTGGAHR